MAKPYELSEEEAKLIDNYRAGTESNENNETKNDLMKKEEKNMKVSKKGLKIAGFTALGAAVLGGVGLLIKKVFFDDPSGLDDFDEDHEEEFDSEDDDLFDEDDLGSSSEDETEA